MFSELQGKLSGRGIDNTECQKTLRKGQQGKSLVVFYIIIEGKLSGSQNENFDVSQIEFWKFKPREC